MTLINSYRKKWIGKLMVAEDIPALAGLQGLITGVSSVTQGGHVKLRTLWPIELDAGWGPGVLEHHGQVVNQGGCVLNDRIEVHGTTTDWRGELVVQN